jgi:hypothetical protein
MKNRGLSRFACLGLTILLVSLGSTILANNALLQKCSMSQKQITIAQKQLKRLGFYSSTIDGVRGRQTITALHEVESRMGSFATAPYGCLSDNERFWLNTFVYASFNTASCNVLNSRKELIKISENLSELGYGASSLGAKPSTLKDNKAQSIVRALIDYENELNDKFFSSEDSKRDCRLVPSEILFLNTQAAKSRSQNISLGMAQRPPQLSNEVEALLSKIKEIELDRSSLRSSVASVEVENKVLQGQLISFAQEKEKFQEVLKAKNAENEKLMSQISEILLEKQKIEDMLDKQKTDLKNNKQKTSIIITDLEAKVLSLSKSLDQRDDFSSPQNKRFELASDWTAYQQWITPSQMRFCGILHDYDISKYEAAASGNQLMQNLAIQNRDKDIEALLSSERNMDAGFRNWVSVVESVFAMNTLNPDSNKVELAAGVILRTPCNITLGTGRVLDEAGQSTSKFKYLAFEGDLIFSQLASVRRDDPVLFDGSFEKSVSGGAEMIITNELGILEKIEAYTKPADAPDMFVNITYLSKL